MNSKIQLIDDPTIVNIVENMMDAYLQLFLDSNRALSNSPCQPIHKNIYMFDANVFLQYIIDGKYYVDINHIITCLTDSYDCYHQTYADFRDKIVIAPQSRREFIDMYTMAQIIFRFDGEFTRIFRQECIYFIVWYLIILYYLSIFT